MPRVLVIVFGALAVFADRGSLPFDVPEAGVLLVPVAFGVAVSAGGALRRHSISTSAAAGFGWRQPLGILAMIAVVVGSSPESSPSATVGGDPRHDPRPN